jgi:hypothetical protein
VGLDQRAGSVDDRRELAGIDQLREIHQVLVLHNRDERAICTAKVPTPPYAPLINTLSWLHSECGRGLLERQTGVTVTPAATPLSS